MEPMSRPLAGRSALSTNNLTIKNHDSEVPHFSLLHLARNGVPTELKFYLNDLTAEGSSSFTSNTV
jgi:hypothetical protein